MTSNDASETQKKINKLVIAIIIKLTYWPAL